MESRSTMSSYDRPPPLHRRFSSSGVVCLVGTLELGRHATSVASLPRALAIRRWGTTHRSNRREALLVGALRGNSFGLHHLKSSRLSPGGLGAGGLPLFAVSFLFPFSGPFQRVDVSAAPLPQSFPALSQCVGKRVRRHIEKRELVAAAVEFPTHRHIEEGIGSRRMRFRGHVAHTP